MWFSGESWSGFLDVQILDPAMIKITFVRARRGEARRVGAAESRAERGLGGAVRPGHYFFPTPTTEYKPPGRLCGSTNSMNPM